MNLRIIMLGKNKDLALNALLSEYQKMISAWHRLEFTVLKEEPVKGSIEKVLEEEGQRILKNLLPEEMVIVLDEQGKSFSSEGFASFFSKLEEQGKTRVVFVIGSSHGLAKSVKERANLTFSLSTMTMSHQVVRLVLLEQLYRIFSIQKGKKYHH